MRDGDALRRTEEAVEELARLANLPGSLEDAIVPFIERRRNYQEFWAQARATAALFREVRLRKEDRERLWSRKHEICARVKQLQTEERHQREARSAESRSLILPQIREARQWTEGGQSHEDFQRARQLLGKTNELLRTRFLLRDHRQECWEEWKAANARLGNRRQEISDAQYATLSAEISSIQSAASYGDPYEAVERIKDLNRQIKGAFLTREHRGAIRERVQEAWDTAQRRIAERRAERARKHAEWRSRAEAKIDRLSALLAKNDDVIRSLEDQIDRLEEAIRTAWNEDWADQRRTWIAEKHGKIEDIQRTNRELEAKIADIRRSLSR